MKDLIERLEETAEHLRTMKAADRRQDSELAIAAGRVKGAIATLSSQAARIEELEALLRIEREHRENNAPF